MRNVDDLNQWWNTGRMTVDHPGGYMPIADDYLKLWVESVEPSYRLQLPTDLPELDLAAAAWACRQMIRTAQLTAYRELGVEFIAQGLELVPSWMNTTTPAARTPAARSDEPVTWPYAVSNSHHYSVDVFFRFLPDLYRLAQAASLEDPLLRFLQEWAAVWPLSGVGIPGAMVCDDAKQVVQSSPGLRVLYRERLSARSPVTIR